MEELEQTIILNTPTGKTVRLAMKDAESVRNSLNRVVNWVANGQLKPSQATVIKGCADTILSSIRIDEKDKLIEELQDELDYRKDVDNYNRVG